LTRPIALRLSQEEAELLVAVIENVALGEQRTIVGHPQETSLARAGRKILARVHGRLQDLLRKRAEKEIGL
jgi:hypothetical protein